MHHDALASPLLEREPTLCGSQIGVPSGRSIIRRVLTVIAYDGHRLARGAMDVRSCLTMKRPEDFSGTAARRVGREGASKYQNNFCVH
jgi:hypothetical protein